MSNTLENKAKFFAQYWGQNVYRIKDGIDNPSNNFIANDYVSFLELKPLSSISDEDAIFCIKDRLIRDAYDEDNIKLWNFLINCDEKDYTTLCEYNGNISASLTYPIFKALVENHFDVFGLIEQGKAININTL